MDNVDINWFNIIEELVKKGCNRNEFEKIPISARIDYIKNSSNVNIALIFSIGFEDFVNSISDFPDDESKCKYLLKLYSITQDNVFLGFTKDIKDDFYKMKLREVYGTRDFSVLVSDFINKSNEYKEILTKIEEIDDEEEIYKFVSTIKNKDINQLFFYKTEDLSKRKMLVDSIEEDISNDIVEYVKVTQKMIFDYFENNSNGLFTEKEKIELQMIFKRTKVMFVDEFDSPIVNR